MNEDQKYLFDLTGYLIIEDMSPEQREVMEAPHIRH